MVWSVCNKISYPLCAVCDPYRGIDGVLYIYFLCRTAPPYHG